MSEAAQSDTATAGVGRTGATQKAPARWWIIGGTAVALLLSWALTPAPEVWGGELREEIGHMLRQTARIAFVLLLVAYWARPLAQLTRTDWSRWLVRHRRYFGLSMALAHTVHFGYVVALFAYTTEELALVTAVFGGLAFALMWLMAATSNRISQVKLGAAWHWLHLVGMHYLWLIFMQSFAGRIDGFNLYTVLVLFGLGGLLLRIFLFVRKSMARSAT